MSWNGWIPTVVLGGLALVLPFATPVAAQAPSADEDVVADADGGDAWEKLIYIPFKELKTALTKQGATVFLPYLDYLKLQRGPQGAGIEAVVTAADYTARIEGDLARIEARLTIQALDGPWAEAPLRFGSAAIGRVESEDDKVLIRGVDEGLYSLLLPSAGRHDVRLEMTAKVRTSPEGRSLDLQIPPVGITTFELVIPEADQTVELEPQLVSQPADAAENETRVRASLGSTQRVSARWHSRVGARPDMDLLASVTNHTLVSVEDGLVHTNAALSYEILRGQLEQLRIAVPLGQRILDVSSEAKVRQWNAEERDGRQVLTVDLLSRVTGSVLVEVVTERPFDAEPFDVAGLAGDVAYGIHALDVVRESGQLAVRHGNELTLTVEQQTGLMRIDESEVAERLRRPGGVYYKFYSPSFRLQVSARPVEPRLILDHYAQHVFRDDELRLNADLRYAVERAGVFEIRLQLPDDLTVENVTCDQMQRYDMADGVLTIALNEKRQGELRVFVKASRELPADAETTELVLPLLEPIGVERETGHVLVYAPESIEVVTDAAQLVGAQPEPSPDSLTSEVPSVPNARLVSAWSFNRRPVEIPARTVRKPTRLTAEVGTTIDVQQELVEVTTLLSYAIEYAGIDTFRFSVPEALADRIQIVSASKGAAPSIKQKTRAPAAVDGWVAWTVVMQREVEGVQQFRITYDLQPTQDEEEEATSSQVAVEPVQPLAPEDAPEDEDASARVTLARVAGEIAVIKDRALSVAATSSGGDVEPIDPRELTFLGGNGFLAYRYFKQPVRVELEWSKHDVQEVVETVVAKALVESVLNRDGQLMHRCRYRLKSSERQRLRVDLPDNVEPLGVLVGDRRVALEKNDEAQPPDGWEAYYVNVARTTASDEPFSLTFLFRGQLSPAFEANSGELQLRLPQIGGDAAEGVAVQQMRVVVWVPEDYTLVGSPGNFLIESRPPLSNIMLGLTGRPKPQGLDDWIDVPGGGMFDFPTQGRRYQYSILGGAGRFEVTWWTISFFTWVVSGALLLIGFALRNTAWEHKLTVLLLIGFGVALFALRDADQAAHALAVGSYGFGAMLVLWLVYAVFGRRPAGPAEGPPPRQGPPPPAPVVPPPGVFEALHKGMKGANA